MEKSAAQSGFTLVELLSVITIVGVLAAVSLPRYFDLGDSAHRAVVSSTSGSVATSVVLANAACLMRGWANRDNLPGYHDGSVDFNGFCFPTDTSGNANTIANNGTRCMRVWNAVLSPAPSVTTAPGGADYRATAAGQVCTYRYLADADTVRQFTYDSRNGAVALSNP